MPGFNVSGLGGGDAQAARSSVVKPVYNYTWDIDSLFEESPSNVNRILAKDATLPIFTIGKDTVDGLGIVCPR